MCKLWSPNSIYHERNFLGEMADLRSQTGNVQDGLGFLIVPTKTTIYVET